MNRTLMFIGTTVGGYGGWWLGESLGFELMGTFLISSLGSLIAIYITWRLIVAYLE